MVCYDGIRVCSSTPFTADYASPTRGIAFRWNVCVFQIVSDKVSQERFRLFLSLNTMSLKAKSEDEPALHLQSHVYKEKDKVKPKRKDDKAYRAPPKQLLGEIHTDTMFFAVRTSYPIVPYSRHYLPPAVFAVKYRHSAANFLSKHLLEGPPPLLSPPGVAFVENWRSGACDIWPATSSSCGN